MVTTIVLLNVQPQHIDRIAQEVLEVEGVTEVYSVAGRFDLVVVVRTRGTEELAQVVPSKILKVEGITHSETLTAFRVYSRHDLERMFSVGLEGEPATGVIRGPQ
ncbi:MAG TPA: Lrp/AsnC ligand binding domain-containing protein [Thermoanaerobaculia bacterium]|jgi:DNA-binding Lrp family transcriptional regulator|nr:Lrp/AsnC ligand binding domain-containing protein [Thermoanaerobaculia bacterium]